MKKMMIITCMLTMLLAGCDTNKEYIRSSQPGELKQATLDEVYKKFENEDDFILLITFSYCSHCQDLKAILEPYLENHHVVIYELIMDKLVPTNDEFKVAKDKLNTYLKDFEGTPSFYYIEDGKKKEEIIGFGEDFTIDKYDKIIEKSQLDAQ